MTFSDPEVRRMLDAEFVVTWHNQAKEVFPGEPGSAGDQQPAVSEHYLRTFPDGSGGGNVRMFFCTPDGRIVHAIEGYYQPASFHAEVAFARQQLAVSSDKAALERGAAERLAGLDREIAAGQSEAAPRLALLHVLRANLGRLTGRLLAPPDAYMVTEPHVIA